MFDVNTFVVDGRDYDACRCQSRRALHGRGNFMSILQRNGGNGRTAAAEKGTERARFFG